MGSSVTGRGDADARLRELLRQWRLDAGLTQAQLADCAGVSEGTVNNHERGGQARRTSTLTEVLNALALTPDQRDEAQRLHRQTMSPVPRVAADDTTPTGLPVVSDYTNPSPTTQVDDSTTPGRDPDRSSDQSVTTAISTATPADPASTATPSTFIPTLRPTRGKRTWPVLLGGG